MPRHSPHALSSLTIKLVHKQNSQQSPDKDNADRNAVNKNMFILLVYYLQFNAMFFATCSFSTMYSVIKYQDLELMIKALISADRCV